MVVDPYLFGGGGLITYNYGSYNGYDFGKGSFFSYCAGGFVEFIIAQKFGLSIEAGYGKLNVSGGQGVSGITEGGRLHYYIF